MSDKLLEALKAAVLEIKSMHPIELKEALKEASKSEFAQTIDVLNNFTNSIHTNDNEDSLYTPTPIESNQLIKKSLTPPIENTTPSSKSDTEDPSNTELVSKTPYSNITTYREKWHTLDNTNTE